MPLLKTMTREKTKSLWTENIDGSIIKGYKADNEYEEGRFIALKIEELIKKGRNYKDFAILYRTNAQFKSS